MVSATRLRVFLKAAINEPLLKHQERGTEWLSSLAMLAWASVLFSPGDIFARQAYSEFAMHGYSEINIAAIFASVGAMRVVALLVNGAWPKSPFVRIIGATAGIVLWGDVAYLLSKGSWDAGHTFSVSPAIYTIFAVFEVLAVYRAAFDSRYHPK